MEYECGYSIEFLALIAHSLSDSVVIATGANFPDALAASALAGSKECPIVLTPPDELSDRTKLYLEWAKPTEAYIIGGESAVSSEVEESLRGMGMETNRVFGADRYDTSLRVMEQVQGLSDTVIVATGKNYADTLSIGPWSYVSKSPVVLAGPDGRLSDDALEAIDDGGFGFLTYRNKGSAFATDFNLYIPVMFEYGWGVILPDEPIAVHVQSVM